MPISFWDERAKKFAKNPSSTLSVSAHDEIHKKYKDVLQKKTVFGLMRLSKKDIVLDAGCAVGRWAFAIAPKVKKVYGIDVSGKMISIAKKIAMENKVRNVEFKKSGVEKLPFKNGFFDVVLSVTVLQHVPPKSRGKAVAELARVCKNGGTACILESTSEKSRSGYLHPLTLDQWKRLFEKKGFALVKSRPVSITPVDDIFRTASSVGSGMKANKKSGQVRVLSKVFKSAVLCASMPVDLYLSRFFKNLGDQKVIVFRKQ